MISEHPVQWRRVVREFITKGLAQGQPCLCLYSLYSRPSVCCFLDAVGVDAAAAQKQGLLSFLPAEKMFNQQDVFSSATCMGALVKAGRDAVPFPKRPVRVVADMNWAADSRLNHQRLLIYEDMFNRRLLPRYPTDLLCHYDRALFTPAFLDRVLALHQGAVPIPGPAETGSGLVPPLDKGQGNMTSLAAL